MPRAAALAFLLLTAGPVPALELTETGRYDLNRPASLDYDPTFRITLKETLRHHFFDKTVVAGSKASSVWSHLSRHILRLQI